MSRIKMLCSSLNPGGGLALGVGIGAAIGVATGNLAVWIGVGAAIGAAIASSTRRRETTEE